MNDFPFEWPDAYRHQMPDGPTMAELYYGPQDGLRIELSTAQTDSTVLRFPVFVHPSVESPDSTAGTVDRYILAGRDMMTGKYCYTYEEAR